MASTFVKIPGAISCARPREQSLEQSLRRLEEHVLLLERCHRMVARSFAHLETRRGKATTTSVTVAQAGQVNVDCAVVNNTGG